MFGEFDPVGNVVEGIGNQMCGVTKLIYGL